MTTQIWITEVKSQNADCGENGELCRNFWLEFKTINDKNPPDVLVSLGNNFNTCVRVCMSTPSPTTTSSFAIICSSIHRLVFKSGDCKPVLAQFVSIKATYNSLEYKRVPHFLLKTFLKQESAMFFSPRVFDWFSEKLEVLSRSNHWCINWRWLVD